VTGAVVAILGRELRSELRAREIVPIILVFGLLVLVIMNFAFEPSSEEARRQGPGVLWVSIAFSAMLGLARSASRDEENGNLEGLAAAPVDRGALYLAKVLANALFAWIAAAVLVPLFLVFYDLAQPRIAAALVPVVLLGVLGFVAAGTVFAAIAVNTRMREVLLPVLLLPVVVPVLLAAVEATGIVLRDEGTRYLFSWLRILAVFDFVYLIVSYLLFDHLLED
jgi:heme exporter protein B